MSESAFKQPISLLLRQEWVRFGGKRNWPHRPGFARKHATAAAAPEVVPRTGLPWTPHHESATADPASRKRLSRLREEPNSPPLSSYLTDNFSRTHNYLRISITERCNLRCVYCMPENGVPLSPPTHLLTTPEIVHLSHLFVSQGVDKIRLTGGEPTVRKDILELMRQIGALRAAGLKELCLTTNGLTLHRKLDAMVEAGLTGVNLSLDTLDPYQFTIMTRRNGHDAVMRSIERILEMNKAGAAVKLKINCVVMRGINEREIVPFVELGKDKDIEVRFIEYMPFDGNKWSQGKMLSFREMLAMIREKYPELQKVQDHANDTSKTYQVPGFLGRIGFITSMTENFCGTCNRLRITSDGSLKVCLFGNSEVSLRDILRESSNGQPISQAAMEAINKTGMHDQIADPGVTGALAFSDQDKRLLEIIGAAVKRKKAKHAGMGQLENMKNRPMILIDDYSPTSFPLLSPSQYVQKASLLPVQKRPSVRAPKDFILHNIPSLMQLRAFHGKDTKPVIRLRNTLPTRPKTCGPLHPAHSQHAFRKIKSPDPASWITPSEDSRRKILKNPKDPCRVFNKQVLSSQRTEPIPSSELSPPQPLPSAALENSSTEDSSDTCPISSPLQPSSAPIGENMNMTSAELPVISLGEVESGNKVSGAQSSHDALPSKADHLSSPQSSNRASAPHFKQKHTRHLSHLTSTGDAHMVDISHKLPTRRSAAATAFVLFSNPHPYGSLTNKTLSKGDAIAVARIAGIQAAKKTADLIPLAHPGLGITGVKVNIDLLSPSKGGPRESTDPGFEEAGFEFGGVKITAHVSCDGKTGVEMEALTAASTAALTMYDMCKAVDKHMLITGVRVVMKKGGKSGDWRLDGDIPDPSPPPVFEHVLERRMAGIVHDPEAKVPVEVPAPLPHPEIEDPPVAPEATDAFLHTAATELALFIANTTSPAKAAEIAGLRGKHKALTARIKELQRRLEEGHGVKDSALGAENPRDGRVDFEILHRLQLERRAIARRVLAWRIGRGSEIGEAGGGEGDGFQDDVEGLGSQAEKEGKWGWKAGVYGAWKGHEPEKKF